ncbi:hypothetical protein BN8_03660 [Fibrisoma limi BUZ 3]|uniref:Phage tail protein n=1 Tax=Fibrisoma limi BUZ 3 TaxID=1185876 RepID=I2GKQ9_9BACT|nr:hypothetical protein [Fibrisoma limi]CCH54485.1 hypothetical protein BN8_03660 [Fibrisoma limi BUZ 3]
MAQARTQTAVFGKDELIWVTKPGGSTPVLMGCMTNFDEDVPGAEAEELACREGISQAPAGDVKPQSLQIELISRRFPTGQQAGQVTADEIKKWVKDVAILTIQYGGKFVGDPIYTVSGWFSNYQAKNPQKGFRTASVKFNPSATETESTVTNPT